MSLSTRQHVSLANGQVWRSSDPRRLSAFRIDHVTGPHRYDSIVFTTPVYPLDAKPRVLRVEDFHRLGAKGFVRVS
jgi:hypothetical protein